MISMQSGLAATASLNWLIMVSGAQAENCSFRSTPNAAAACAAPVWRASVAPSPALPPICMYMVSAFADHRRLCRAGIGEDADRGHAGKKSPGHRHDPFSPFLCFTHAARPRQADATLFRRALPPNSLEGHRRAKKALRRCGSST